MFKKFRKSLDGHRSYEMYVLSDKVKIPIGNNVDIRRLKYDMKMFKRLGIGFVPGKLYFITSELQISEPRWKGKWILKDHKLTLTDIIKDS